MEVPWKSSHSTPIRVENDFFHEEGFYVTFEGNTFDIKSDKLKGDSRQTSESLFNFPFRKIAAMGLKPGYRNVEVMIEHPEFKMPIGSFERKMLGFDVAKGLLFETDDCHYIILSNSKIIQFTTPEPILKCLFRDDTSKLVCYLIGETNVYLPLMYMYYRKTARLKYPLLEDFMKKDPSSVKPLEHTTLFDRSRDTGIMKGVHPLTLTMQELQADKRDTRILTYGTSKVKGQRTYFTNDNGRRRFKVVVKGNNINVFKSSYPKDDDDPPESSFDVHVWSSKFYIIYIPNVPRKHAGNSILVRLCLDKKCHYQDTTAVYIGETIYSFQMDDDMISFRSPIDEHGVSRPVAVGFDKAFVLSERVSMPKATLTRPSDEVDWFEVYQANKKHAHALKDVVNIFDTIKQANGSV